jgi:response regulator of citrate/malate metabolism
MRVLIVEDEPAIAQDIEDIALSEGFTIAGIATNAREAMELAPEADVNRHLEALDPLDKMNAKYRPAGRGVPYDQNSSEGLQ